MAARKRRPRRQRPCLRARLVEAPVSSMKTSFVGSRSSCPANHSRRRLCTSARCCSSACAVFFKGDPVTVEETPQHGDREALVAIGDQPLPDLEQRDVRRAPDQAQEIVAMRLDPARAAVAARRRRRNLARGCEPLHPRACEDRRKEPSPPPPSRGVNDQSEINRFGNPPADSVRSNTALLGIHLTGLDDLSPRAVRRRSLQAGRMSTLSRRLGRNSLWALAHNKVLVTNRSMRDSKLQDPIEQHPSAT